jgi:hypothetical protein
MFPRGEAMSPTYLRCEWIHDFADEPRFIYSELDDERYETFEGCALLALLVTMGATARVHSLRKGGREKYVH